MIVRVLQLEQRFNFTKVVLMTGVVVGSSDINRIIGGAHKIYRAIHKQRESPSERSARILKTKKKSTIVGGFVNKLSSLTECSSTR